MSSAWLSVPLADYEGHMNAPEVGQLSVLAELFSSVLKRWCPQNVIVLGVAGGNGLEAVDPTVTKRIVGVDINEEYLAIVKRRFGTLPGLELKQCDLSKQVPNTAPAAMVHAALVFEHAGLGATLDHALALVAPSGTLSVVLQLPSTEAQDVAATVYTSMQTLKDQFALIDVAAFQIDMQSRGLQLIEEDERALPGGKAFWLGVFVRPSSI